MRKLTLMLAAVLVLVFGCESKQSPEGGKPGAQGAQGAQGEVSPQTTTVSMKFVKKLEGHAGEIEDMAFSSDGMTLVTAAPGDTVRVWDLKEGKQTASYEIKSETAVDVDTLPGGNVAILLHSGGGFGPGPEEEGEEKTRIVIWNPKDADKTREIEDSEIDFLWKASRIGLTCSPDGRYIATLCYVDKKDGIRVWNVEDLKQVKTLDWPVEPEREGSRTTPPDRDSRDIAFSPDGSYLFVRTRAAFHRWKTGSFDSLTTFEMLSGVNAAMAFSNDGKKLAYLADYAEAGVVALPDGKPMKTMKCFAGPRAFAFDPSGNHLFYGVDKGRLFMWNLEAGALVNCLDLASSVPEGTLPPDASENWEFFAVSPDGKTLAAGIGKVVCLWSLEYAKKSPVQVEWPENIGQAMCGKCKNALKRIALQCPKCGSALDWSGMPDESDGPEAPMRNMFFGTLYRNAAWIRASVTEKDAQAFADQWPEAKGSEISAEEVELFKKLKLEVIKKGDDSAHVIMKKFLDMPEDITIPAVKKDGKWKLSLLESEFFRSRLEQGKMVKARVAVMNLTQGLYVYEANQGEYPDVKSVGELVKELANFDHIESSSYPLNEKGELIDPWGTPYVLKRVSEYEYRVYSCGPNGKDDNGEGDDVTGNR